MRGRWNARCSSVPSAMSVGPRVHHADEVDADVRRVGARVLLEVHELLAHREAATTERLRPVEPGVARVVELALPRGVVRAARRPVAGRRRRTVTRHLDVEPGAQLGAEPFVGVAVRQVHVATVSLHVGLERGAQRERVRVAGPEARLEHPRPLEEVVRRHLPGEAHAAEDLHRGAPVGEPRFAREHLRGAHGGRHVAGAFVVDDRRGRVRRAAGELDAHVHVGEQVLDGLERTDRHAELVALERVRRRDIERALRDADELRGREHRAGEAQPSRVVRSADRLPARQVGEREGGRQRIERFARERFGKRRRSRTTRRRRRRSRQRCRSRPRAR